jgi:hypothetical protein
MYGGGGGGGGYQQQPPYYQQDPYNNVPPQQQQQWNAPAGNVGGYGGGPSDYTPLDFPNYYATSEPPAYPSSPAWGAPQGTCVLFYFIQ